ncbi:MAG TPA: cytochrome c oxidase assembly protein [Acetobacteraceae bacterium]|nr:cytochrome c oxidase assembly protein [Acetobacteraceae bacterium]
MPAVVARRPDWSELLAWTAALGVGLVLWWASATHPASLPAWAPWDFSWQEFAATAAALWWYGRGLTRSTPQERPAAWRQICFLAGLVVLYVVLQTRFLYLSQHMFFLNRLQHLAMHHLGPFLIALGRPGATIRRGMPAPMRRLIDHRAVRLALRVVQQPIIAAALFVGLIALWLLPPVHFAAMIDPQLYAVMNWSMVVDGILFWSLVLDPQPRPPARLGFGVRAILAIGVMFPQILMGSVITFSNQVLYPYYDLCGRVYPTIDTMLDQHLGGIVVWIPGAMMSVIGFFVVLNNYRLNEEAEARRARPQPDAVSGRVTLRASAWTGR